MTTKWWRPLLAAVIAVLAATGAASPALASGTLTVGLAGAGTVGGSGINCSRTVAGATSGICSKAFTDIQECDYSGPKPPCHYETAEAGLTATPVSGFAFDHWAGACTGTATTCAIEMSDDETATAVFRDSAPPSVTLTSPSSGPAAGKVSLAATASDNVAVARVDFSVRGSVRASVTSAPYSYSLDTSALADGVATVAATAYDTSGNMTASSTATITIDNTKPTLTVTGPDGQTFGSGSTQTWSLSASDATSGLKSVQCSVVASGSPASFGACSGGISSHTVSGRPAGSYTFTARATDQAGNVTDVTRSFTVDTTPPQTSILGSPPAKSGSAISFMFSSSKDGSTFKCRLDAPGGSGSYSDCASPMAYTGLVAGNYRFHVVATDAYGNADPSDATWDFQVDTTPPDTTITSGSDGTFSFTSNDASASFECQLDAGAFTLCVSPQTYSALAPGDHLFVVRAIDQAGNVDPTPDSRAFTIASSQPSGGSGDTSSSPGGGSSSSGGGATGLPKLSATLVYDYLVKGRTTKFLTLRFKRLPAGATVSVRCSKGCGQGASLKSLLHKPFKAGATITITVSKPGMTAAVKTFTMRASKRPKLTGS